MSNTAEIDIDTTVASVNAFLERQRSTEQPVVEESPFGSENLYYAWGRLGRKLVEPYANFVLENLPPNGHYVYLDACSSTPWLREVMRGQYRQEVCVGKTNSVINNFKEDLRRNDSSLPFQRTEHAGIRGLREGLLKKDVVERRKIEASIMDLVFEPQETGVDVNDPLSIYDYFVKRFYSPSSKVYREVVENGSRRGEKGSWIAVIQETIYKSTREDIEGLILTSEEKDLVLKSMASHFAKQLAGNIRTAEFLSMDIASADTFADNAYVYYKEYLDKIFFKNVLNPRRHIQGDVRDLSGFADNSLSFISIIESFPLHKQYFQYNDGLQIGSESHRTLMTRGIFLNFPFTVRKAQRKRLEELEHMKEYFELIGLDMCDPLSTDDFEQTRGLLIPKSKGELLKGMGERELRMVADPSSIFNEPGDTLPLLVAVKRAV